MVAGLSVILFMVSGHTGSEIRLAHYADFDYSYSSLLHAPANLHIQGKEGGSVCFSNTKLSSPRNGPSDERDSRSGITIVSGRGARASK